MEGGLLELFLGFSLAIGPPLEIFLPTPLRMSMVKYLKRLA